MAMTWTKVQIRQRIRTAQSEGNRFEEKRWTEKLEKLEAEEAAQEPKTSEGTE